MVVMSEPNTDRLSHPQTDCNRPHNPYMGRNIRQVLADNVTRLMESHPRYNSNQKLAAASGLGLGTISRVKSQESAASIETVEAIAQKFGLTPSQLLQEDLFPGSELNTDTLTQPERAASGCLSNSKGTPLDGLILSIQEAYLRGSLPNDTLAGFEALFNSLHRVGPPADTGDPDVAARQGASLAALLPKKD